eukprot:m.281489 g.281489  ORF g.281489 m.281489 type:complete len:68 (+) comp54930_c0_seq23:305-508(+)
MMRYLACPAALRSAARASLFVCFGNRVDQYDTATSRLQDEKAPDAWFSSEQEQTSTQATGSGVSWLG